MERARVEHTLAVLCVRVRAMFVHTPPAPGMPCGLTTMLPRDPHSEKHSKYVLHKPKGVAFEQLCIGKPKNLSTGRGTAAPRGVTAEPFVSLETLQKQVRAARWH